MTEIMIFKKRATARDKRPFCRNGNTLRYWQANNGVQREKFPFETLLCII